MSSQGDAMELLGNVDVSWRSSCTFDEGDRAAYMRISIGEFIASHSEALGSLDGSQCVIRVSLTRFEYF